MLHIYTTRCAAIKTVYSKIKTTPPPKVVFIASYLSARYHDQTSTLCRDALLSHHQTLLCTSLSFLANSVVTRSKSAHFVTMQIFSNYFMMMLAFFAAVLLFCNGGAAFSPAVAPTGSKFVPKSYRRRQSRAMQRSRPLMTLSSLSSSKNSFQELNNDEISRYSRHLVLNDVGMAGQKALKNASVLVIGAGGLGSPCLLYLAAAGVGYIGIVVRISFSVLVYDHFLLHFDEID